MKKVTIISGKQIRDMIIPHQGWFLLQFLHMISPRMLQLTCSCWLQMFEPCKSLKVRNKMFEPGKPQALEDNKLNKRKKNEFHESILISAFISLNLSKKNRFFFVCAPSLTGAYYLHPPDACALFVKFYIRI